LKAGETMDVKVKNIAKERERVHKDHKSSRPLSSDYEYVGLIAESKFAEKYGFKMDETLRPGGDEGKDFVTEIGTIDVKSARKAFNLIVEEGMVKSDIYVLAQYNDEADSVSFLGWAYKKEVLSAPMRDFGYGIINHYIPKRELHSMFALEKKLEVSPSNSCNSEDQAKTIGEQRQSAHPQGTPRYYKDPNAEDTIGVAGEIAFAKEYGLKIDDSIRPDGDGHVDFKLNINDQEITIDVKTANKAYNLLIKEWEIDVCANILVLAQYESNTNIRFLGWETKDIMKLMPKKIFSSLKIVNYYRHKSELRPMSQLDGILGKDDFF
jgi:hypothetical protein